MTEGTKAWIRLHPSDNCIVALKPCCKGERLRLEQESLILLDEIPAGHKVATLPIPPSQPILKYGWPIGVATQSIGIGEHIHVHNLKCEHQMDWGRLATETPQSLSPIAGKSFEGYVRENGSVGTRNYIAVISTVNCSASVSRYVAQHFGEEQLRAFPNVDGVVAFKHDSGCGMAYEGIKHRTLSNVLGGIARHPNIAAYVLIGLGCEQNTLGHLLKSQKLVSLKLPNQFAYHSKENTGSGSGSGRPWEVPVLSIQDYGGTRATVRRGVELVNELLPHVNAMQRTKVSAEHLVLATKCGGSDGYSGITANPALGVAADLVIAAGGTAILSETTELYGAEQLFTRRAQSEKVARQLLERLQWWHEYAGKYGEEIDNNPSLGNKAGGLTTIVEKSLGAASKGGSTALQAVIGYAEPITSKGLVIMDAPGFDPACVTGMAASGANVIVFTTGRGSCFGCKPVPSLKVATNSELYRRMADDMDLDMGTVLETETLEQAGARMFEAILETASGKKTKSELLGYGDDEFVPWSIGPTL
jgi:altronate hydrolase